MFGSFDCDDIDYTRKLSEKTTGKVRQIIADNFPEAEKARNKAGERYNTCFCAFDLSDAELSKLCTRLALNASWALKAIQRMIFYIIQHFIV